jgi:hypothetical protein
MFVKSKGFFKKRFKLKSIIVPNRHTLYLSLLKLRPFFIKGILKKLIKLSKKLKVKTFVCFRKNLIISKKSKNSRMGKGKGANTYKISFFKNKLFLLKKVSKSRFLKIKSKVNYFIKNKVK